MGGNYEQINEQIKSECVFVQEENKNNHLASYSCGAVDSAISQGDAIGVVGATLYSANEDDATMVKHLHLSISGSTSLSKIPGYFLDPIAFAVY